MTESEKDWLLTTFRLNYFEPNKILTSTALPAYYEAERILSGRESILKRGCKCEYPNLAKYVTKKYKEFLENELHRG
jgi:hypothetical protein